MRRFFAMGIAIILGVSLASAQPSPQKRRIAVMNFDYSTVQSWVQQVFQSNVDVGKGISDLLVNKLVEDGTFRVIERKQMDKILAEQNFSNSDRADPNTAAKIGRLLGVDAIVVGSITQFGRDDKTTKLGGGVLSGVTGKYGLGGVGTKSSKAVVGLTARLVNIDTAEILAIASGKGESARSGTALLGSGGGSVAGGAGYDMQSSNFANTILGEAVTSAVSSLAKQLEANAQALPAKVFVIDGLVADVSGDTLVLNVGSRAGLKVGDTLHIKRVGREIRDPATGKVIRRQEDALGEISITEVDEQSSVGRYSGGGKPKVGDAATSR